MISSISKISLLLSILVLSAIVSLAQDASGNRPDATKNLDLSEPMRENLAKHRIKEEEEQYQELIKRSEEAAKISEELTTSYEETKKFTDADSKKIDRLEKVVKKIRQDLGAADDDDATPEAPSSLTTTLETIKSNAANLLSELKKTTRYSVSVVAIESSNTVWKLLKFVKLKK